MVSWTTLAQKITEDRPKNVPEQLSLWPPVTMVLD